MKFDDYLQFIHFIKNRFNTPEDYFNFQHFQAELISTHLENIGVKLGGKVVLDVGSAYGGYSSEFISKGAKVITTDLNFGGKFHNVSYQYKDLINMAKLNYVGSDALKLPFKDGVFDFVFCSSLIEHVPAPSILLFEMKRVMKKDALCYLSFPPYYSPVGGHEFKPFHIFPNRIAVNLTNKIKGKRYTSIDDYVYRRTVRNIKKLIIRTDFKIKKISTRFSPVNFARIPLLNEFLTWHVEFILKKS